MTIDEYTSDLILKEVDKLQYFYELKRTIRYAKDRSDTDDTESVAEHIYGIHVLTQYFLQLEDIENKLDREKIYRLITIHDFDEIETGDILGQIKTEADRKKAREMLKHVIDQTPLCWKDELRTLLDEYEDQSSAEARFVKAVDKVEPLVHLYNKSGRETLLLNKTTAKDSRDMKDEYVKHFPFIEKFYHTLQGHMETEGYFYSNGK